MAIMRRCCCFNDTRSGTLACTIYSLIYASIFCALAGWGLSLTVRVGGIVVVMYYIEFIAFASVVVSSIIAIVGVSKDIAPMLLPYIISVIFMMVAELTSYIVWFSILGLVFGVVLILPFVIFVLFVALNIICVLCVVSQYQELRAGRGRLEDVTAARTTTTVVMTAGPIVTQYPPPGTFVVTQQQPGVQGVQPGYGHPGQAQPGYAQPGYAPSGQAQPGYAQPGYDQATEPPPPPNYPGEVGEG